ncbi:CRISPR-associated protein, Csn1 family [Isoalcanivorax pacificus W11-5]|uniref:CRISPR-associated protein, Csn1 family n=2 Tax=Isoalcanivorax TaxID=3020833 RepID=A0A0B4XGV6_9GAMM|nr:CRISPR-associated protein, Csn1 family [Isoalcanivorax pacificus W11-5]
MAVNERIELGQLRAVLLRMGKKRGYGGTFKAVRKVGEAGEVASGASRLEEEMVALASVQNKDSVTVGEYLAARVEHGLPSKLKVAANNEYYAPEYALFRQYLGLPAIKGRPDCLPNMYALRHQIEHEFERIWATQSQFHDVMKDHGVKEEIRNAIFFQRPLKSPADKVGRCSLQTNLPRAPRAQIAAQNFRIEKQMADLRWGMGRRAEMLNDHQKAVIRELLNQQKELSFRKIYKELERAGCPGPEGKGLNMDRAALGGRDDLSGNTTLAAWRKLGLEDRWQELDEVTQIQVINFLADLGSPEQLDTDDWSCRFMGKNGRPRNFSDEFVAFMNELRMTDGFDRLSKMGFEGGRSSYSIKALKALTEWMIAPHWRETPETHRVDEEAAIRECYPESLATPAQGGRQSKLEPPPLTGNEVVDVALRQVRHTINMMIDDLGSVPAQIVVEMAREMKGGVTRRNDIEKQNKRFASERKKAAQSIEENGKTPTPARILRYQLWIEQGHQCPYCESNISLEQALSGAYTNFEHILPRTLTQIGRKRSELVLAHRECNDEKGNRTPYQAFGHDDRRWRIVEQRANALPKKSSRKTRLLLLKDFEGEALTDESIDEFADRQLHESSWLAKVTTQWLSSLGSDVYVSRGSLTAELRRRWGLDTVIPQVRFESGMPVVDEEGAEITPEEFEKFRLQWEGHRVTREMRTDRRPDKRIDHRHHLVDAIVTALTSRSLYQQYAKAWKVADEKQRHGRVDVKVELPMPILTIRDIALEAVRSVRISHKPDRYPDGRFFEATAYGIAQRLDERSGEKVDWLVSRKSLTDLAPEKKSIDVDKVRANISRIVGEAIRLHISNIFEKRVSKGMTPQQALREPIEFQGNILRKVRCFYSKADDCVRIEHSSRRGHHYKMLLNDGFAYMEVPCKEGILYGVPNLVRPSEAVGIKRAPESGDFIRFYKGDTVKNIKTGRVYTIKQILGDGGGKLILTPVTETKPADLLSAKWGRLKVGGRNIHLLRLCAE